MARQKRSVPPVVDAEYEEYLAEVKEREEAAQARVFEFVAEMYRDSVRKAAPMVTRVAKILSLRTLFDELDQCQAVLDNIQSRSGLHFPPTPVRNLLIFRHFHRFIDAGGMYPAKFYKEHFDINSATLRQAVRRKKLKAEKRGKDTLYAYREVQRCWPHLVTYDWPTVSMPRGRDKA